MIFNNLNESHLEYMSKLREQFLHISEEPLFEVATSKEDLYYIYLIKNSINDKLYVGKCKNIYDRANGYIRAYINNGYNKHMRSITKAIVEYGIDKFDMYLIATCNGIDNAAILEYKYIEEYDCINNGYNTYSYYDTRSLNRPSVPQTTEAKMKKSKIMLCINHSEKIAFITIGMKLFGDYTNTSKDWVKNWARGPYMHDGFYIIYLNHKDRMEIYNKTVDKINRNPNNVHNTNRNLYLELSKIAGKIAENPKAIKEYLPDYELYFMTYNEMANTVKPYKICPIEDFIKLTEN